MSFQNISIPNSNGEMLRARLEFPPDKSPNAYAIFAHCFTCNSDLGVVRTISRELTGYGFGVLRFDFTGLGSSEGEFADTNFSHNLEDLNKVNAWLAEHYQAPSLIVGHSLGGAAALFAASRLDNIKAVATIGAPASPRHVSHLFADGLEDIRTTGEASVSIGGRPFTVKKQFIDDLEQHDLSTILENLRKPFLILHSPQDRIVGIENAGRLYKYAHHPKSFVSLDGGDHLLSDKRDALYAARTIGTWADRYVLGDLENKKKKLQTNGSQIVAHLDLKDGYTTQISNSKLQITADEPVEVGGQGLGFTPYDLLSAALGACTSMTLKLYAERKGWPLQEVYTYLDHSKQHIEDCLCDEKKGEKIDHIEKRIEMKGDLSQEQKMRLLEIAEKCPVNRTLKETVRIKTTEYENI